MRFFSSTKILVTALFLLLAPMATNAIAADQDNAAKTAKADTGDKAKDGDHAKKSGDHNAHDDHGEKKKKFPLGAVSFAFIVLGILLAPACHRLNVGGDFTGSISTKEESSGH